MLYPSIFNENLFDDLMDFDFPVFKGFGDVDKKLYGKHAAQMMKTDVHEHENQFEVDMDLPGFKKDEITLDLEKGYLTVTAAKGLDKDEKDKKGKLIRQERYAGTMRRSFFIGENLTEEDVKAKYEDGVLKLIIPKKEAPKIPEKKTIMIEG
ncbi:MAG: Hsp20/alpha crystallin family protein [Lachnospiraceae bacterium]|nr:Hsp20/alpha crystallin family protein [Lachnospiraceae bacterium]